MGCVESSLEENDMQETVFQVESFDEHGQRNRSVRLEVTENTLILHNKTKTAVRWPLRCLRRYGFDGETFSFESGRRCPSGPGIYTYRCRRAGELFSLLQHNIKSIADRAAEERIARDRAQALAQYQAAAAAAAASPGTDEYLNPIVVDNNNRLRSNSIMLPTGANNNHVPMSSSQSIGVTNLLHHGAVGNPYGHRGVMSNSVGHHGVVGNNVGHQGTIGNPVVPYGAMNNISYHGGEVNAIALHEAIVGDHGGAVGNSIIPSVAPVLPNSNCVNSPVASPHTPISPANGTLYINNTVLVHETLKEVERGSSAPPPTPAPDDIRTDCGGTVWLNCNDRSASFVNSNERPSSHASLNSDRPISSNSMNHVLDRPLSFVGNAQDPFSQAHGAVLTDSYEAGYAHSPDMMEGSNHVYMNVGSDNRRDLDRLYANMGFDKDIPSVPPRLSITTGSAGSGSSHNSTTTDTTLQNSQVNYIVVDVDKGSDSSQVPPFSPIGSLSSALPESPPTRTAGERYATIDFERTEALTNTAKMANCHANGGRHNSTFSGVISLPHHNSSYSE